MNGIKCLVTFAKPYSFIDEKTNEMKKGITVEYLMAQNLKPTLYDDGSMGVRHCKESIETNKLGKLLEVPGYYDLVFSLVPSSKGKPVSKLVDLEFMDQAELIIENPSKLQK